MAIGHKELENAVNTRLSSLPILLNGQRDARNEAEDMDLSDQPFSAQGYGPLTTSSFDPPCSFCLKMNVCHESNFLALTTGLTLLAFWPPSSKV
jgi:hypothetical protein